MLLLYWIERAQPLLPWWNPQKFAAVPPALAFNTAASFTTNTNWQNYSGEATMSYLTQMAGLALPQLRVGGGGDRAGGRVHSWHRA
jgi:potassium-transporting ATPase potassium-binding subunit